MFQATSVFIVRALTLAFCASFVLVSYARAGQAPKPFSGQVVDEKTSAPVAGAVVTIGGVPGSVRTGTDGRFTFGPSPAPPFQVIVVLAGGQVAKPVLITTVDSAATVRVNALADESVTVVGAAPSIDASPGAATTLLSSLQVVRRAPENLMQALETVPGINQVSEGHAAVPAIRGLARGRVLLLIDGARVTSERRVGPSATFLDPAVLEGIDVARGPGSVAYGSDALGGVISMRTKERRARQPAAGRRHRALRRRHTGSPRLGRGLEGLRRAASWSQAHVRDADDYDSPEDDSEIFNSGWEDGGLRHPRQPRARSGRA